MAAKKVRVRPLGDRVLVKELSKEETERTTAAGIIIPDTVNAESKGAKRAKVVAVGEGRREDGELIKPSVKVDDVVLFTWGDELVIDDEEYFIVNESSILAVIEK